MQHLIDTSELIHKKVPALVSSAGKMYFLQKF